MSGDLQQNAGKKFISVAIDGPAAAGKGTLARQIAKELSLNYLDTGLLYRALAAKLRDKNIDSMAPGIEQKAAEEAKNMTFEDLERKDLRNPDTDRYAGRIAGFALVRAQLLAFQREFAAHNSVVMDGRDIGTVILPQADVKIFITAALPIRAERRFAELRERGVATELSFITEEMQRRDHADMTRAVAPLRPADDAFIIDTGELTENEVLVKALTFIRQKLGQRQS